MAIYHLVLLKFKDLIPPEEVKSVRRPSHLMLVYLSDVYHEALA